VPHPLRIVFAGLGAGVPHLGGLTWVVLNFVLGFRRLGHDVWFIEPVDRAHLRPAGVRLAESENAAYLQAVAGRFGLTDRAALIVTGGRETVGLTYEQLKGATRSADVLFNVSGMLDDPALFDPVPVRVYLDLDPGFVQLWHAVEGIDMRFAGHTHFASVGRGLGREGCPVPTCGRDWLPTFPPVVLTEWDAEPAVGPLTLTTVAHWRGYGSIRYGGAVYGQKAHSLRPMFDLPGRTGARFRLALAIDPGEAADLEALTRHGWELIDPRTAAGTPDAYRAFVGGSAAEFGIAKSGYVVGRTGWFSDRSACYLAAGRPVLAQDTGYAQDLPADRGLLRFTTADDVSRGVDELRSRYRLHAAAAREVAAEYLDSDRVLGSLLDRVGGRT
jgi:hypothetical protein